MKRFLTNKTLVQINKSLKFGPASSYIDVNLRSCSCKVPLTKTFPEGPTLNDFISNLTPTPKPNLRPANIPYLASHQYGDNRKVYFDIYGCQMNVNDTEVIWSILKKHKFVKTEVLEEADVILVVTCAIREGAEQKIWNKIDYLKGLKNRRKRQKTGIDIKIGLLGCMAERLKHRLVEKEKAVDIGKKFRIDSKLEL